MVRSQVDDDVFDRSSAADQDVAFRGRFQRFGVVAHRSGQQCGLAVVAYPGPARPPRRDVARLGEFQQARVRRAPRCRDATARERDFWTSAARARRLMRRHRGGGDPRRECGCGAEQFGVDAGGLSPSAASAAPSSAMKAAGPHRYASASSGSPRAVITSTESRSAFCDSAGGGAAVEHPESAVGQAIQQRADLSSRTPARRRCEPRAATTPARRVRRERVQHREHRGDSDSGGQQDHRVVAVGEEERAPRRGHVERVTDLDVRVDVPAGSPVRFPLDADPVVGASPAGWTASSCGSARTSRSPSACAVRSIVLEAISGAACHRARPVRTSGCCRSRRERRSPSAGGTPATLEAG